MGGARSTKSAPGETQALIADSEALEEPLLGPDAGAAGDEEAPLIVSHVEDPNTDASTDSLLSPIANLSCTIIGSGIIALPKVFQVLGIVPACIVMVGVAMLSFVSIGGLARASIKCSANTYSAVVRRFFGTGGSNLLRLSMIFNCGGILIVYMVMIMDILVGGPKDGFEGVIPSLVGIHDPTSWATSRRSVLALVLVLVLGPVACMREMKSVSITSAVGLCAVAFLVVSTIFIFVAACFQGKLAEDWSLWPVLDGDRIFDAVMQLIATVPVVLSAYICHQSVHPVMGQIRPLTVKRFNKVVVASLVLCSILYISTSLAAYMLFGQATDSDILANFTVGAMKNFLPDLPANFFAYSVRVVFSVALMMAFPLSHFAYRDNMSELVYGCQAVELRPQTYYGLTFAGLGLFYLTACTLPNIFLPLAIIGASASVTVAFIFPALLMHSMATNGDVRGKLAGVALFGVGLCVSVSGLLATFLPIVLKALA